MTLSRAFPLGITQGQQLPAANLNVLDVNAASGIDGVNGGTYNNSAVVQLNGDLKLGGVKRLNYAARSITRSLVLVPWLPDSGEWRNATVAEYLANTSAPWSLVNKTSTTSNPAVWQIADLPNGQAFSSVNVRVQGAPGHAAFPGGAPTTKLKFNVKLYDIASGTYSTIGTATDTSASAGVYEAVHTLSATGMSHVIDRTANHYIIECFTELGGAGALVGDKFLSATATLTVTDQSEW